MIDDTKRCVNGCDAPIASPSRVICRACQDKITRTLAEFVRRLDERQKEEEKKK